jgi:hypothetical protein
MKELNSDFTNAKVGDKVYHLDGRVGEVIGINNNNNYPISFDFQGRAESCTMNGKVCVTDTHPSIFTHPVALIHADDLDNIGGFKERVMEVSSNKHDWKKRVVFGKVDGFFTAWNDAKRIEDVDRHLPPVCWKFAREINHRAEEIKEQIAALQKELETIENSK